jgi:glycosyltransferase involved in cell wall biosynthesis
VIKRAILLERLFIKRKKMKSEKKKILAIACMPFYQEKGSSLRLYSILKTLSSEYEIDLVTYSLGEDIDIKNVNIYRTPKFFKPNIGVSSPSCKKLILDKFVFFKAFRLLLFSSKDYEVLHCEDFEGALVGMILKKFFKKRMVYLLHNRIIHNWEIHRKSTPSFVRFCEKKVVRNSDLIIANWKMYLSNYIFQDKNIFLHYDSLDTSIEECDLPFSKYLFYSGNFEKYQGIKSFLRVYKNSKCRVPVVLAGKSNREIVDFIKKNELEERVVLLGRKSVRKTNFLIQNSVCCLLPRVSGVQPGMKMIHYLLGETPVIARDMSCNTELLRDGFNSLLYKNEKELEDILNCLEEEGVFEGLRKGLKKTKKEIEEFTDERRFLKEYGGWGR